jgi:DNA-binding transcriptional MerR regulator
MRIGELAARAGVNVQTILFYERRRLLPRPPRTGRGYRSYVDADLEQVRFIRQTQQLGFSLREIAALLPVHGSPRNPKSAAQRNPSDELALYRIVRERLAQVDVQIKTLRRIRSALRSAMDASQSRLTVCPVSILPRREA